MKVNRGFKLCASLASVLLFNSFAFIFPVSLPEVSSTLNSEAYAARSGGRGGGGSFGRSRSSGGSSRPYRSSGSDRSYGSGGSVYVGGGGGYSNSDGSTAWAFFMLFVIICLVFQYIQSKAERSRNSDFADWSNDQDRQDYRSEQVEYYPQATPHYSLSELDNNTVTVSKVQVALLAQADHIQKELSDLTLQADTSTPQGRHQFMQEAVLTLLRSPEYWSHVVTESQPFRTREAAEAHFNQLSIAERSKFDAETLSNMNGRMKQRSDVQPDPDAEPASYIVVTLLVGTANDQPLFSVVRSAEALQMALNRLAAISQDYLLVFELMWSPENPSDSLTRDELLTQYTDLISV